MKLQEVILRVLAGRLTWSDAAEIAGVSYRNMIRIRERYHAFGYDGIFLQCRKKRSRHSVPVHDVVKVLTLFQTKYPGCSLRLFHDELRSRHGLQVNYEWLNRALRGAGLISESGVGVREPTTLRHASGPHGMAGELTSNGISSEPHFDHARR